jgi:PAS domain S-box-containing protein
MLENALTRGETVNVTREPNGRHLEPLDRFLGAEPKAALILPLTGEQGARGQRPAASCGAPRRHTVEATATMGLLVLGHDGITPDEHQLRLCRILADQVAIATGYIQTRFDIGRQSRALTHLIRRQEQEAGQLRAILESIADGVIVSDANDQVILTNDAALDILGGERDDVLGNPFGQIIGCMAPAGNVGLMGKLSETSPYGNAATFEVSERVVQMSMAPVEATGRIQLGVVAVLRDVTALAGAEAEREQLLADLQKHSRQLEEAAERLKEMDRLKSQFIASMSHELHTPLNAIIGFSGVLLKGIDGPLTDAQRQDLETILKSGKHLLALIKDVLDVSQIWAGKMELALSDVDLAEMIEDAVASTIPLIGDKPIELMQALDPILPLVRADETRARQVLLNLLTNAVKYTEQGRVTVSAFRDDGHLVIGVADTGIGISPEHLEVIFEEFGRVDDSSTRKVDGLGLGLSISRRLVELHDGRIWVESEPGIGSTFYFSLPIAGPLST